MYEPVVVFEFVYSISGTDVYRLRNTRLRKLTDNPNSFGHASSMNNSDKNLLGIGLVFMHC